MQIQIKRQDSRWNLTILEDLGDGQYWPETTSYESLHALLLALGNKVIR